MTYDQPHMANTGAPARAPLPSSITAILDRPFSERGPAKRNRRGPSGEIDDCTVYTKPKGPLGTSGVATQRFTELA